MKARKSLCRRTAKSRKCLPQGHVGSSDFAATESSEDEHPSGVLQKLILKELQRVNHRLDMVEEEMDVRRRHKKQKHSMLSTPKSSKHCSFKSKRYIQPDSDSSSSYDIDQLPYLSVITSSTDIQRKVDAKVNQLEKSAHTEGNKQK